MAEPRTVDDLLTAARSRIRRLEPFDAWRALRDGALVVDTRCADQRREMGTVPGAVHIPLSVLYWRLDPGSPRRDTPFADRDRPVVVLCAHGYSSSLAAATLADLGFADVADVVGGFEAWQAAGLPVEAVAD